jgi:hypothetical protein
MILSAKRIFATILAGTVALAGAIATSGPALAQYTVAGAPGVANISIVQGDVVIVRGDSGAQVGASINAPLLPGDYLSTAGDSRAEVQFDGISMLRLAQDTQVRFVNLNPGSREVQVASGTSELAQLQRGGGTQIDTPSLTVRPKQPGNYRVSVLPDGETQVTVRSGSASVSSGSGTQTLTPGTTLVAYGPYSNPRMSVGGAIAYDAFDNFNQNRNNAVVASYNSDQYLAPELSGYANFSNYGQWSNVPGYGQVWAPYNQVNNWTPYSNGQWVWEPGYGYTWVGNEPWGYAPYHYGRWFNYNNQWMWQPPGYQYQTNPNTLSASWLPALVGFFLTGGSGAYGPGYNGNIGWVPLAPGEQYSPWYPGFGANPVYPQYGMTNVTNVYNIYRNYRYVRIVRVYPVERFRDGDWHRPILMHPDQLRRVTVVRGPVPIVPTRALMHPGPVVRTVTPVKLSPQFENRRLAARTPTIQPVSFAKSQEQLQSVVSKPPAALPPPHATTVKPPAYQAPTQHKTYAAPVMKPVPPKSSVPVHTAVPVHAVPVHTAVPVHAMPVQTMRPVHTAAPVHAAPIQTMRPVHTAVPVHTVKPPHPAAPVHTAVPPPHAAVPPVHTAVPVHAQQVEHPPAAAHAAPPKEAKPKATPRP